MAPCFATYLGKLVVAYCLTTPSHCLNYLVYNLRAIYKSWYGHGGESDNATLLFLPAYYNIGIGTMWHCTLAIYTPSHTIGLGLGRAMFWYWVSLCVHWDVYVHGFSSWLTCYLRLLWVTSLMPCLDSLYMTIYDSLHGEFQALQLIVLAMCGTVH